MATVVLLVALRLCLGCHFLYEGVWKIKHADEFSAEPFLSQAKGPLAPLFHAMLPDIDGRQRLQADVKYVEEKDQNGRKVLLGKNVRLAARWDRIRQEFVDYYRPRRSADEQLKKRYEAQVAQAQKVYERHLHDLELYLADHREEFEAHIKALDRFEQHPEAGQGAPFQKERRWQEMAQLRAEARGWLAEIDAQEQALRNALADVFAEQVKQRGPIPPSRNPFRWTRIEQINFAVTWGLTAIGLCLLVGLFTRPAAMGGALFMAFVVMTQPAWPTIFPHDPPVVGHALLVNKDFIEMVALLVVASTAVGRWAGLDYFFGRFVHDPICARWCPLRRWCPCCGGAKSEAAQTPASTPSAAKPAQ